MSWSLYAVVRNSAAGRASVAARFAALNNPTMQATECGIRDGACALVLATMAGMPDNTPVQMSASGSAMMDGDISKSQQVRVDVQPLYGDFIDAG